jgi:hypothetical protein
VDEQVFPRTWATSFPFITDRNKRFANLDVFFLENPMRRQMGQAKVNALPAVLLGAVKEWGGFVCVKIEEKKIGAGEALPQFVEVH